MTEQLPGRLQLWDCHGRTIRPNRMVIGRCIKYTPDYARHVYQIMLDGELAILKLQDLKTPRSFWRTIRGQSYHDRETAMLADARASGLLVPHLLGSARRRWLGVTVKHGLLFSFFDHATNMRDRLLEAQQRHDDKTMRLLASQMVDTMVSIRQAGFADKDFGVHNLLLLNDGRVVWSDLERSYHAAPSSPIGNIQTAGSALASWWVSSAGDQKMLQGIFQQMVQRLEKPDDDWPIIVEKLNLYMMRKVQRFIDAGWFDHLPEALKIHHTR